METILPYAIFWGVILVAYGVYFRRRDLHYKSSWAHVFSLPPALAAVSAQWAVSSGGGVTPTPMELVWSGGQAAAIASLVYGASVWAYNRFVDDSLLQTVRADFMESSTITDAPEEKRAKLVKRVDVSLTPEVFAVTVAIRLSFVGLVAALPLAWVLGG